MVAKYPERKYFDVNAEFFNEKPTSFHAKMTARIKYYMKTRKQRFATILGILIFLQVIDNFLKIFGSRSERSFKNYKILLIHYLYPEAVLEKTAKYSNYSPKHLSEASEKILGEKFVYLDRKFKNGLTRQMIADWLRNWGKIESMIWLIL